MHKQTAQDLKTSNNIEHQVNSQIIPIRHLDSNPNAPNFSIFKEILWNVLSETYLTTKNSPQIPPTFVDMTIRESPTWGGQNLQSRRSESN